jgi:aminopeptidase N
MTLSTLTTHEAKTRSDLLEVQRYDIDVDMTGLLEGEEWRSTSTITFACSEPGATTFVDVAMDVTRATLNGDDVDVSAAAAGRLPLPALAADNVLVVEARTTNTATGEGILRTVDPTDKLVYVWTSLEPDEARRVWACFDQPDLKAPHRFVVTAPSSWLVTSNGAPESVVEAATDDARVWTFPDTPRLSTYVVVVNACGSSTTATTSGSTAASRSCRSSSATSRRW